MFESVGEILYNDITNETHCKMDIGEGQVKTKENKKNRKQRRKTMKSSE